jgi:hypothetical protein
MRIKILGLHADLVRLPQVVTVVKCNQIPLRVSSSWIASLSGKDGMLDAQDLHWAGRWILLQIDLYGEGGTAIDDQNLAPHPAALKGMERVSQSFEDGRIPGLIECAFCFDEESESCESARNSRILKYDYYCRNSKSQPFH